MSETTLARDRPMARSMAISIVDADELVRGVLADQVRELDSDAGCFETLSECLEAPGPDVARVIVFGPSGNPAEIISWIEARSSSPRGFGAVMVVSDMSPEVLQRALRAEIDDVVSISAGSAELREAIERAHDRIGARQPEAPASPAVPSGKDQRGRVVTVFSTKGGAGKSVLATNVAVALARRAAGPVVLVDADLRVGDVALMLQLQPTRTVVDAVEAGDRLDTTMLDNLLLRDPASGLLILAAPTEARAANGIEASDLGRVLAMLRHYAYVVVDTPADFTEITRASLEAADDVLLVAGLDVMSLKSARADLETTGALDIPPERITFVLNRANSKVGLTEGDAARVLQRKVDVCLPSDILVARSVNRGIPAVLSDPRSKFAKSICSVVDRITAPVPDSDFPQAS